MGGGTATGGDVIDIEEAVKIEFTEEQLNAQRAIALEYATSRWYKRAWMRSKMYINEHQALRKTAAVLATAIPPAIGAAAIYAVWGVLLAVNPIVAYVVAGMYVYSLFQMFSFWAMGRGIAKRVERVLDPAII